MNTTENNKLIAEFMGYGKNQPYKIEKFGNDETDLFFDTDLKFHSDWNWLMPVVEKIDSMLHDEIIITIQYKTCVIPVVAGTFNCNDNDGFDIVSVGETKLEAVYTAVIEFIKWYNLNK